MAATAVVVSPTSYVTGFEGPEKKLEIEFRVPATDARGLRALSSDEWQGVLDLAACQIISMMSNDHCDAYVLSESSLFVYRHKLILKTCGTTTLLCVVPKMLEYGEKLGLGLNYVFFSRKSLNFPTQQKSPHTSFEEEVTYLNKYLDGHAYILGPLTGDYWLVYQYDCSATEHSLHPDVTLEIMMHDLDTTKMQQFYRSETSPDARTVTRTSGISDLLPGSKIDDFLFDPCGYSMNGLLDKAFWTIHITPEPHCSYVSFETNVQLHDYTALIQQVLDVFQPGRFTVTVFADEVALPADMSQTIHSFNPQLPRYKMKTRTYHEFEASYNLTMCNYVLRSLATPSPAPVAAGTASPFVTTA